ncbi:hypothetical protein HR45_17175 [Shewanella mangrovi]|uniref:Cytochrome c domain-containing protein n=1 Tax=Shewanella mangrovi TaxID=1515746 RepID=A0A094LMG8_9GAMM|nr:cytochrome c [Shewanella mangrovi]KFZ36298.1 hypothetical protein HR45_17175 [Shewanella mangrovi]
MIKFSLVIASSLFWVAFAAQSANPIDSRIAHGKQRAAICTGCHGERGISSISEYPNLAGQSTRYLIKQLQDFQQGKDGREDSMMNAFAAQLSAEDIENLAAFYTSLPAKTSSSTTSQNNGEALYMGGDMSRDIAACSACHGVKGRGLAAAGFPALAGQSAHYIEEQLQAFKSGERHNDINGMMGDVSRKLNDKEIAALAAYIETLK